MSSSARTARHAIAAAQPQNPGGSPRIYAGRSALALRKNATNDECALALGTNSGACAATVTTQRRPQFSIRRYDNAVKMAEASADSSSMKTVRRSTIKRLRSTRAITGGPIRDSRKRTSMSAAV
jgi:hypothetical protein